VLVLKLILYKVLFAKGSTSGCKIAAKTQTDFKREKTMIKIKLMSGADLQKEIHLQGSNNQSIFVSLHDDVESMWT
jgi:hypothetical protein